MRKHINSETTNYQDELTEVLVLDDKPVVNSFNGITSDAVARAVDEAAGTSVNLVQGSGITLTESSGNVTISADAQLPAYSDADSGKVLQVQADGTLAWVTLS